MNLLRSTLAIICLSVMPALATPILSDAWAPDGEGNRGYSLSSSGLTSTVFRPTVAGTLDSFVFYLLDDPATQPMPATGSGDITVSLFTGLTNFPGSELIAELPSISVEEVAASPTVTSAFGFSFYEVVVDLSSLAVEAAVGDTFSIASTVAGTGTYQIIGTGSTTTNFGPNPGFAPNVNRLFAAGGVGGTGSGAFSNSFQLFVDDGTVDPIDPIDPISAVPLPAGLPLLLAGLGAFGLIRRRA